MESKREKDEFDRIPVVQELEKARQLIGLYDINQAFWRDKIEDKLYNLGKLDERLGGGR